MYMTIHCYPEQIINAYYLSKKEKIVLPLNNNNNKETKPDKEFDRHLTNGICEKMIITSHQKSAILMNSNAIWSAFLKNNKRALM